MTFTPTKSQTPAPAFPCVLFVLGDSYVGGDGSSSLDKSFARITSKAVTTWYPGAAADIEPCPGAEPSGWVNAISPALDDCLKKLNLPIGYMIFQTGPGCFFNVNNNGGERCKGASLSEGVSYSYAYQKNMDKIIAAIYAASPDVNLVVLDTPDSSGGAGHYAPPEVYEAYRQRLFELRSKYHRMRIADVYVATKGHSEYFHHEHDDKDHPNDVGQAAIAKCILDQMSYWPYKPGKH